MRSIQFLYNEHKNNRIKRQTRSSILKRSNRQVTAKELREELKRKEDERKKQDYEEGLSISKELILEAWCKFRPSTEDSSPRPRKTGYQNKEIEDIFGPILIAKLMAGIRVRHYNQKIQKENEHEYRQMKNELMRAFEKKFAQQIFEGSDKSQEYGESTQRTREKSIPESEI